MPIRQSKRGIYMDFGDGTKYHFGGEMLPLSAPSKARIFMPMADLEGSDVKIAVCDQQYPHLERLLPLLEANRQLFKTGACRDTAEQFRRLADTAGLTVEFYSGWLLLPPYPLFHAWCVATEKRARVLPDGKRTDQFYLIDLTHDQAYWDWFFSNQDFIRENPIRWRTEAAKVALASERLPLGRNRVLGRIPAEPVPLVYVGSPDTWAHAMKMDLRLLDKYPNHPSFGASKGNRGTLTPLQIEIERQRLQGSKLLHPATSRGDKHI